MADDTITEEPTGQSSQVENPQHEPEAPLTTSAVPSTGTIALESTGHSDQVDKAVWTNAYQNDLPDSAFLFVEPGDKDGEGKTIPRSKRHFPVRDASGKLDAAHLRNAIARIPQSNAPGLTPEKKRSLQERARQLLGNQDKEMYDEGMTMGYPYYGAISFGELENLQAVEESSMKVRQLTDCYQMLIGNIMHDEQVADKGAAINQVTAEFTSRLERAMNPMSKEKRNLLKTLKDFFTGKEADKPTIEPEELLDTTKSNFMVWKDSAGQYRWFAIYSNQFRDEDNPPEIISEKSHRNFIDLVESNAVDYPELWHWHIPGSAWGKADWLDYADGFAVASGYVYPGHEKEAEAISTLDDIRVSHGMPSRFIVRNKQDPSIIDVHVTAEISDLPGYAAANPLTQFVVLNKEFTTMAFTPEKRQYLEQAGLSGEAIAELESNLAAKKEAANDAGLESKEQTPADKNVETPETATPEAQPAYVTAQEVAEAVAQMIAPFTEALNGVTSQLAAMQAEVKALKEADADKVAKAAAATPRASLQSLIAQSFAGMQAAQIDGRTTLAKAGPKQAPSESQITGVPFLDGLIQQAQGSVPQ